MRCDSGTSEKSAKTWGGGVGQPASALMGSPVCHPQCGYNDWKKVEVVELMKRRPGGSHQGGEMGRQDHCSGDICRRTDDVYTVSICTTDGEKARRQGCIPK